MYDIVIRKDNAHCVIELKYKTKDQPDLYYPRKSDNRFSSVIQNTFLIPKPIQIETELHKNSAFVPP